MKKTQVVKVIFFLLAFFAVYQVVTGVFIPKWRTGTSVTLVAEDFYEQKKDTVEVLVIGSSQAVYGISSMRMMEEYGISTYSLATGEQPLLCSYFYLREACNNHEISTVLLDTSMLFEAEEEARFRKTLDTAPLTLNKLDIIKERSKSEESSSVTSYLFPIIKYHSRWDSLQKKDFVYDDSISTVYRGNILSSMVSHNISYDDLCVDGDDLGEESVADVNQLRAFEMIVDYCKEKGLDLVLIKVPKVTWNGADKVACDELAACYGLDYIDFNTAEMIEKIHLDVKRDFWNKDHLNVRGADKVSDYLGEFLLARGQYEDFRNTESYALEPSEEFYHHHLDKYIQTTYDLEEYLSFLSSSQYDVVIQKSGDTSSLGEGALQQCMSSLGLCENWTQLGNLNYVAHIRGGKVLSEQKTEGVFEESLKLGNGKKCTFSIDDEEARIKVAGKKPLFEQEGMRVVIYDYERDVLVDSVTIFAEPETGTVKISRIIQEESED